MLFVSIWPTTDFFRRWSLPSQTLLLLCQPSLCNVLNPLLTPRQSSAGGDSISRKHRLSSSRGSSFSPVQVRSRDSSNSVTCRGSTFNSHSLAISSTSSEKERKSGPCSGLGFGLRECCGWFDILSRLKNFLHISNKVVSLSYHSCVHWSSTFNFLQELFLCSRNLANWHQRPSFQHAFLPKLNYF